MKLPISTVVAVVLFFTFFGSNGAAASNYTRAEKEKLQKFRNLMQPKLYRDFMTKDKYLIRWLRNSKMNLEEAQRKLSWSLDYRKENKIDSVIHEEFSDYYKRYCKNSLDGQDRDGRPVVTSDLSSCKTRELIVRGLGGDIFKRHSIQFFEKLNQRISDAPDNITDAIAIFDFGGFTIRGHACAACLPLQLVYHKLQEDHYPLIYHRFFMINVPKAFVNIYQLIQEGASETAKERHFVYGFNKAEWQPELLKRIAPDQLTTQYGGTKSIYTKPHKQQSILKN